MSVQDICHYRLDSKQSVAQITVTAISLHNQTFPHVSASPRHHQLLPCPTTRRPVSHLHRIALHLHLHQPTMAALPPNIHVSQHPCLRAKLSQLRSQSTSSRETKQLVHEIATMIGYEALASGLSTTTSGTVSHLLFPLLCHFLP